MGLKIILDNGAHTIKAGLASNSSTPSLISNAAIRSKGDKQLYIGQEFEGCRDYASLTYRYSFERGYLTDWDVQKAVWDNLFGPERMALDLRNTSVLITEPPFNFHGIQEKYDQLMFEEYEFESYVRCPAAALTPYGSLFASSHCPHPSSTFPECSIIVDSGFSFTHVIPIMQGQIVWKGVRRIDVGGKLLTNHLANLVSFRQWNMLDQTHIVNDVKEKCCYVTTSFKEDLERSRLPGNDGTVRYVLPDFSRNRHGYVRENTLTARKPEIADSQLGDSEQILYMTNERFSVPELLFNPSDIGLSQGGIQYAIADSILSLPEDIQGMFWANIGLIGGNMCFPNFANRLKQELRALAPTEYDVELYPSEQPVIETYKAAHAFVNSPTYDSCTISREEYNEGGTNACRRKFRAFDWDPIKETLPAPSKPPRRDKTRIDSRDAVESSDEDSDEVEMKKDGKKSLTRRRESAAATTKTRRSALRR